MKYVTLLFVVMALGTILFSGTLVFAAEPVPQIQINNTNDLIRILNNIARLLVRVASVFAVIMLIYAGFLFMVGGGDDEKIQTAKKIIWYVAIGIAVVMFSYSAVTIVASVFSPRGL